MKTLIRLIAVLGVLIALTNCGGGGGGGSASSAALSISPTTFDYGVVEKGTSSTARVFKVTNVGTVTSGNITTAIAGTDSTEFSIGLDLCNKTSVSPGQSCNITIQLLPTAGGTKSATLSATANPGGIASADLSGVGSVDADGDGYFSPGLDCDDTDQTANPSQTSFSTHPRTGGGYDFNCDGIEEPQVKNLGSCVLTTSCATTLGWNATIPACGQLSTMITSCNSSCVAVIASSTQACR